MFLSKQLASPVFSSLAVAQDWRQWRGPKRDGIAHGLSEPKGSPEAFTLKWKVNVGGGGTG